MLKPIFPASGAEIVPPHERLDNTPVSMDISHGSTVFMANGPQPIAEAAIEVDGENKNVDLVGIIHVNTYMSQEKPRELMLTREPGDPASPLELHRVERGDDGVIVSTKNKIIDETKVEHIKLGRDRRSEIVFNPNDSEHKGWFSIGVKGSARATLEVSEAAHPVRETFRQAEKKRGRIQKLKALGAVALSIFAFKATTLPGGIYDQVMDGRSNAQEYVLDELSGLEQYSDSITNGELSDGEQLTDQYESAVDRVARTMGDLDSHNYEAVTNRANDFEKSYPDEIIDDKKIERYKESLKNTNTSVEALDIMNDFMSNYGSYAGAYDVPAEKVKSDDFRDDVKYAGEQIIDVFGPLPKSLVYKAFNATENSGGGINFAFGAEEYRDAGIYGKTAASWYMNSMNLYTTGRLGSIPIENFKAIISHEFSHAYLDGALNFEEGNTDYGDVLTRVKNIGSHILGSPDFTSDYAASDPGEEAAEVGGDIVRGEISHPDDVLDFESRANKSRLKVLVELEKIKPGITDYLVTRLNPNMVGK